MTLNNTGSGECVIQIVGHRLIDCAEPLFLALGIAAESPRLVLRLGLSCRAETFVSGAIGR